MTTEKTGQTSGGGTATPQAITDHLQSVTRNPTEFLSFFREVVQQASQAGVSQQQLLDYISDNYSGGSGTNKSPR